MHLEIVTPEKKILETEASAVQLPGTDGLFQVLDNHAPIISTLTKGVIKVHLADDTKKIHGFSGEVILDKTDDKTVRIEIEGGVVEVINNKVIVLAS